MEVGRREVRASLMHLNEIIIARVPWNRMTFCESEERVCAASLLSCLVQCLGHTSDQLLELQCMLADTRCAPLYDTNNVLNRK